MRVVVVGFVLKFYVIVLVLVMFIVVFVVMNWFWLSRFIMLVVGMGFVGLVCYCLNLWLVSLILVVSFSVIVEVFIVIV